MPALTQETAETIALKALGWIAGQEDVLSTFLGATGASGGELAQRAHDPEFLISVLDFLMMDDAWVSGFCETHSLPYHSPAEARQSLPGGAQVHWT